MVQDSGSSGDQQGASKMKELNLDLLFGPVKHVSTSSARFTSTGCACRT
jgi:hypothetical protein